MPIHITMDGAATWAANYLLARQPISKERKAEILPATKYNLLVKAFNGSSVLLVAAAVTAVFFAMTSSFVFLSLGLFLRFTTEREINRYTIPPLETSDKSSGSSSLASAMDNKIVAFMRHATHQTPEKDKKGYIKNNVNNIPIEDGWEPNEILFLDFVAWKNTIKIEEKIEPRTPNSGDKRRSMTVPDSNK